MLDLPSLGTLIQGLVSYQILQDFTYVSGTNKTKNSKKKKTISLCNASQGTNNKEFKKRPYIYAVIAKITVCGVSPHE